MSEPITDIHLQMPWGETITFPPHKPLAHGMRLSTHCPVQRVAEYFDEDCGFPFDPGVGAIGHLYQHLWCHQTSDMQGADSPMETLEQPVPWEHGFTHIDRIIHSGENIGVYEVKSTSDKNIKPLSTTIAQMMRQMRACGESEEFKQLLDLPWYNVIIGKAGNESGWVRGPWQVTLDDSSPVKFGDMWNDADLEPTGWEYARWDADATDAMKQVVHDNSDKMDIATIISRPDLVGNYCACGIHRLSPPVEVDDAKLTQAASEYIEARENEKMEKAKKGTGLIALRAAAEGWEPGRYDVGDVRVTKNDEGKVTIR